MGIFDQQFDHDRASIVIDAPPEDLRTGMARSLERLKQVVKSAPTA